MPLVEEFVPTDANRDLFDRVMNVTQQPEAVRMFVYGPSGSGKTTLVQMRGRERDLLSEKDVMFCHVDELVSFFNLGEVGERFLERAGSADVLLIDGFERGFDGDAVRARLLGLLLQARRQQSLSTLVFSAAPFEDIPAGELADELGDFESWSLAPLDEAGRLQLAHVVYDALQGSARGGRHTNQMTDDALEYVAKTHAADLAEMKSALRFLVTQADFDDAPLDAEAVGAALGDIAIAC